MNQKGVPSLSSLAKTIVIHGLYEHYKGFHYRVLAIAHHTETLEELVIYQALYEEERVWARPVTMFLENVTIDGKILPRFKKIK